MANDTDIVNVRELRIAFGGTEVVHGVSFAIAAGETVALVGESGCGKSVTALSLGRLLPAKPVCKVRGEILFAGQGVMGLSPASLRVLRRNGIGYVFQDPATALHPNLKIGYQMCEALVGSASQRRAQAVAYLGMAGLSSPADLLDVYPFTLSGGMQQRVVIAMALSRSPKLLVADEPTTALDVTIQAQILDLLVELQQRLGMAMLLITHNMGLVASSANRVFVMYAGHIVETGLTEAVLRSPRHPYTNGLLRVVPSMFGAREHLEGIPGMVPAAEEWIPGCPFAPRCRYATDVCHKMLPALVGQASDHQVACHHPLTLASRGEADGQ
ncbi:MAG: ABC transporter ATP-binding protein [Kiritimatiellia bacterium]